MESSDLWLFGANQKEGVAAISRYVMPTGMTPILLHKMAIVCKRTLLAVDVCVSQQPLFSQTQGSTRWNTDPVSSYHWPLYVNHFISQIS